MMQKKIKRPQKAIAEIVAAIAPFRNKMDCVDFINPFVIVKRPLKVMEDRIKSVISSLKFN